MKDGPVRGPAWQARYRQTGVFLGRVYGLQSAELKNFHAIRFEPTSLFRKAEEALNPLLPSIQLSEELYYLERLSEADEYLLTLLIPAK
jgi:hypothetical protein